jgi:ubiquinone biosynthesis protein COQ9
VFSPTEEAILSASIPHIHEHGFSKTALALGAKDAGYLDVSINLFPKGAFDLINYHLVTQRLALKHRVQFHEPTDGAKKMGIGERVRLLATERLMANRPTIHRWPEVSSTSISAIWTLIEHG